MDDAAIKKFNQSATDLRARFQHLMTDEARTRNLTAAQCLGTYNNQYISKYGHVLLVQDEVVWHDPHAWAPSWRFENATKHPDYYVWFELSAVNASTSELMWSQDGIANTDDQLPFLSDPSVYPSDGWLCPSRSISDCDTSSTVEVPDRDAWAPYGSPVQHCVVEVVDEQCRLQFSAKIAVAVIMCNVIKAVCIITMLVRNKDHYLVTLGDAIACFLDDPDPETRGRCLHGKALMVKEWNWMATHNYTDPKSIAVEPEVYAPEPQRWAKAASKRRWWMTYLMSVFHPLPQPPSQLTASNPPGTRPPSSTPPSPSAPPSSACPPRPPRFGPSASASCAATTCSSCPRRPWAASS